MENSIQKPAKIESHYHKNEKYNVVSFEVKKEHLQKSVQLVFQANGEVCGAEKLMEKSLLIFE